MGVPGPRRHAHAWTRDCGIGPEPALRSRAEILTAAPCGSRRVRGKCACEWEPGVGTCEWEGAPWPRWADCIPARLGPLALGHGLPMVSELFEGARPGHPPPPPDTPALTHSQLVTILSSTFWTGPLNPPGRQGLCADSKMMVPAGQIELESWCQDFFLLY